MQRVISRNSSEKIEVNAGNRVFLLTFHSILEECVNIYGFDISDQKEVERKLRDSESKYRNIVETSVEGIWIFNAVSKTTYVNEKMAEMLGYNPEEMIGRFIWDFAYEEDKSIFQVKLANRKQGIDEVYELKLIRKDGSPLWVSISAKGFFDDAGKFEGSVGMFTDITERKKVEEALRESEERFRSAFDDSAVAMALVGPDARLVKVNDAFCRLLGFEKSEIEGHTFIDFTYPDDIEQSILIHKAVINSEKSFFWLEKRYIRKDGKVIWCEVSSSPVLDSKGYPIYTVAHIQDITERKWAERALQESEKKYRIVADNTYDWEFWLGPDGHFLYMSPSCERVTGYAVGEFIDNSYLLQEIIHPDDRQAFLQHQHDMPSSRHGDIEFRIVTKDGEIRWIHHLCQPLYDGEGHYAGNRGSNRDITERKRVEEEIQGARNMLQLIMDNIPEGIFWKDCNSRYLGCNKVFAKSAGLESPESIIGKTDYDLPWSPEQTEWFREYDRKIMENDTPEYHIIEQQTTADRKLTWLDTNKIPLHDAKGNVIGILGTYEDITERKEAEESLRLLNLYNRSLIETSLDPLVTIGRDGKITDVNKATEQVTGYSRNDLIGTDFSDYFTEPEKAREGYQKVFDEGFVSSITNSKLDIKMVNITPVLYNASDYRG